MSSINWKKSASIKFAKWAEEEELKFNLLSEKGGLNRMLQEYEVWPKTGGASTHVKFEVSLLTPNYFSSTVTKDSKEYSI